MIYYLMVLIGVFACSASQLLLKKSATNEHKSLIKEMLNWRVITSYAIMFVTLVSNIYAMSQGVMLKDMPVLEALGYVFVPVLSWLLLSEKITRYYFASIILIISGIIIFYL